MKFIDENSKVILTLDEFYLSGERGPEDVFHSQFPCRHVWGKCVHHNDSRKDSRVPSCITESPYSVLVHYVCQECGRDRYVSKWGDRATKILEGRVRIVEFFLKKQKAGSS